MTIIFSENGGNAHLIEKSSVGNENYLQDYIHKNPEAVPIYEIDENKKLFVAVREFPTNSGPIDAIGFDVDGDIYIVETKLYKNYDKRTVVAQALDYGASLWRYFSSFEEFMSLLNIKVQKVFMQTFEEKIIDFFGIDNDHYERLLNRIESNLNEGNFKFVILMDKVGQRLKDLVIYINQNSQFDIFAVQLEYYQHDKYEIIIPKLFGVEVKKNLKKTKGTRIYWDEKGFLDELNKLDNETREKIVELLDFSKREGCLQGWGTGKIPMFTYRIKHPFDTKKKATVMSVWSDGCIRLCFSYDGMDHHPVLNGERKFYEKINLISNQNFGRDQNRDYRVPLDIFSFDNIKQLMVALSSLREAIQ